MAGAPSPGLGGLARGVARMRFTQFGQEGRGYLPRLEKTDGKAVAGTPESRSNKGSRTAGSFTFRPQ